MRRRAVLAVVAAIMGIAPMSSAAAAQAEPSACAYAPAILDASDFLLAEPATFPNFWRDRFGDDAAYLKIRYGGLAYSEGSALLAGLEKRSHPPLRIVELRLAYAKPAERAAMIAAMQSLPNVKSVVPQLGQSALRAIVTEDDGGWLLDELGRLQTADPNQASQAAKGIAQALSVADDEAKSQLAKRAEDAGVWPLALEMRAVKDDLSDYVAYLDRLPPAVRPDKDRRTGSIRNVLFSANLRPSFDISRQPAEVQALDRQNGMGSVIRSIGQLVADAPQAGMLLSIINFSGDLRIGTVVAVGVNAQIAAKQLDPVNKPDAVTAAMLGGLDYVFGRGERESILGQFGISEMQGENAGTYSDKALARLALGPFVRGDTTEQPPRPKLISKAFAWEQWLGLANRLRAGEAIAPEDRLVAAELMVAADRPADALASLKMATDWRKAMLQAHQLALALDRRCADLLRPPVALSQPLYRFDPR